MTIGYAYVDKDGKVDVESVSSTPLKTKTNAMLPRSEFDPSWLFLSDDELEPIAAEMVKRSGGKIVRVLITVSTDESNI